MKIRVMQKEPLSCGCAWKNARPIGIDGELITEVVAVDTERASIQIRVANPNPPPLLSLVTVTAPFLVECVKHGELARTA